MASMIRSFTELSVLLVSLLTISDARAAVFTTGGPLMPDPNGNWNEYRTNGEEALLSDAGDDASCVKRLPANLRQLFFEHFRYYVDHTKAQVGEVEIARFAKVLGMAPHESGGASAAVTDMRFRGSKETLRAFYNTDNPGRNAPSPLYSSTRTLDALLALKNVRWDAQTNFGLLQMSADRMNVGGPSGDLAENMIANLRTLYASHPEEVIDRCGTGLMFKDSVAEIRDAFDGIQACTPGTKTKEGIQCFGRWATLCPNYNIALALIAPSAYFATRKASPLCAKTFRKILKTGRADGETPKPVTPKPSAPANSTAKPTNPVTPTSAVSPKPSGSGAIWPKAKPKAAPSPGLSAAFLLPSTTTELGWSPYFGLGFGSLGHFRPFGSLSRPKKSVAGLDRRFRLKWMTSFGSIR